MVQVHDEPRLRELYEDARFCVCDSRILRLLARLSGVRLPLIPGSDLVEALFEEIIKPGDTIAVVGGTNAVVGRLEAIYPSLDFRHFVPPMGLRHDRVARQAAAEFIAGSKARFTFIAVGMPQQEMIASEARKLSSAGGVAFCIGAGLDFLIGEQKRAPRLLQILNLEWAHRLASNPRRLWRRYLVEGWEIFPIYLHWRRERSDAL
jgi:exopolysaccharide biosynthesis WecB/TagA/CpsF family protein